MLQHPVIVISFAAVVLIHAELRLRLMAGQARKKPRGTIHKPALFNHMVVSYFVLFFAALLEWAFAGWTFRGTTATLGAALYGLSAWIQWRAFKELGEAYSPDIETRDEQPLVRTGLYGQMRHPLLTAIIVELLGVTLFLNAYICSFLTLIVFTQVVEQRRQEEEKVLRQHFGRPYEDYASQVNAFLPRLFPR